MSAKTHSVPIAALQGLSWFILGCGLMAFLSLMPQNYCAYSVCRGMVEMKRVMLSMRDAKVDMERDILALKCNVEEEIELHFAPPSLSFPQCVCL